MNGTTPIKVNITKMYLMKGQYEGYDFYKMVAETDLGIKLSTKLTAFEYSSLKAQAERNIH